MSIASNLKAQLVGQLIDALGSVSAVSTTGNARLAAAQATTLANLLPGQSVVATIAGTAAKGQLALDVNGTALIADLAGKVLPQEAFQTGTQIRLRVETAGTNPRFAFERIETPAPSLSGASTLPSAIGAAGSVGRVVSPGLTAQATTNADPALPVKSPPAVSEAITRATSQAATRQGSAAPLYADLAAVLNRADTGLPPSVLRAASALLAARIDGNAPVTPDDLREALKASGILSRGDNASTATSKIQVETLDIKGLLQTLRDSLRPAENEARRLPADQEPPRRDGPVQAHRTALSSLATETDPQKIAATLSQEADQAHERIRLHQFASLPELQRTPEINSPNATQARQLNFEIPIAFGQQTAMAGFRIERERKRNKQSGDPTDVWGVRFAIDADVLGPVHAHVRLSGGAISVSLWAEEAATHRFFVTAIPMLQAALRDNAFEIGDLHVFSGKPAETRPASSSHFLDRRS